MSDVSFLPVGLDRAPRWGINPPAEATEAA